MATPSLLRVGVIGAGMGLYHVRGYSKIPSVQVVALAGLEDDRVRKIAADHQIPRTYRDYTELLADKEVDAVSVCLPNFLHAPVTEAALAAGKHVLVEKPMARTTEEARRMLAAAERHGRVLMIGFNRRYRGDVMWLKRHIDSGALGTIYYAKAFWMRRAGIPRIGSWFVNHQQSGGGPLVDLGVHVLDMAMFLLGDPSPRTVSASTFAAFGPRGLKGWEDSEAPLTAGHTYDVEDLATALIRLDGGVTLQLEASWATHSSAGDDFGLTLYGTEGGAELLVRNYTDKETLRLFTDIGRAPVNLTPTVPNAGEGTTILERFAEACLRGEATSPTGIEGLRRTAVIEACYRSAAEGRELALDPL